MSLYIHIPWCIRKCPYCDFNSHTKRTSSLPEKEYIAALIADLKQEVAAFGRPKFETIFIGGGTPSLFSANAYASLFAEIGKLCDVAKDVEITLEVNPGTFEHGKFSEYRAVGINRLSLGVQSFNDEHLQKIGRIHDANQAKIAIVEAQRAGFDNLNIDIMHSLPDQTQAQGIEDLKTALNFAPTHISWYQLTIEPNTEFYKTQPSLPSTDAVFDLEQQGLELLENFGYTRYEISAYCRLGKEARHNLNYWLFGDYIGIGAGAHGKLTYLDKNKIVRRNKYRLPRDYMLEQKQYVANSQELNTKDLIFEFMLNTSRLEQKIEKSLFTNRTLLPYNSIDDALLHAASLGLIELHETYWQITPFGRQYTNDLQGMFLT